jgi:hypothetical protein
LKDIFELEVPIEGVDDAHSDEKYIFVEDKHAIGDEELLVNEAFKGENKSNITTFVSLFIIIASASAVCCYLNYSFPKILATYVFYMFVGSFLGDLLVTRVLMLMLLALIKVCRGKAQGYKPIPYKN